MTKADLEFVCLCIYQWLGECRQNILNKAAISSDDHKKWEIHLGKVEEQCKPRGNKLVVATQYKALTQGDMELPEYIKKCRQITDACGWPEDAKDMALRNTILLALKNPEVYQKCLEKVQDSLTAENSNSPVQQQLSKINYAYCQYSNHGSNSNTTRINTDSQSANKASKGQEINRVVK